MVETAYEKGPHTFGRSRARPHELTGCQARVAATMAGHNCCLGCRAQLGRPTLAWADVGDGEHEPISHHTFNCCQWAAKPTKVGGMGGRVHRGIIAL
jgi:hypothetical protein